MDIQTDSLVIFSRASAMLAEADTIQKAKELKSLALTAAEWAKRKNMGNEAIQHCRSYALDAERKMGEMLLSTQRHSGGKPGAKPNVTSAHRVLVTPSSRPTPTLKELGLSKKESSSAQKLAKLPQPQFDKIKNGFLPKSAHVSNNSGENEWYTPDYILDAVREVLTHIDCDPASSKIANQRVMASHYFTKSDDGLSKTWGKRCFINPPYAQPLISKFASAIASKVESKEVSEACVLTNNATETEWFQSILSVSSAGCFVKSRVRFLDPAGNPGAPLQGQIVLYIGKKPAAFSKSFSAIGRCFHVV